jgi:hypothetical protein
MRERPSLRSSPARRQTKLRRGSSVTGLELALMTAIAALLGGGWLFLDTFEPPLSATPPKPARVVNQSPPSRARELDALAFELAAAGSAGASDLSARGSSAPELAEESPPFEAAEVSPSTPPSAAPAPTSPGELAAPRAISRSAKRDALIRVLWHKRGLCADESGDAARARYIAAFGTMPASWKNGLYVYPGAPLEVVAQVSREVPALPARAKAFLGLESEPPAIYVHKNPESLRAYSCVNSAAVAYYDGSIHLSVIAGDTAREELSKSLEHEYVHHALLSSDIERPIWFQEGAAMVFAGESWEQYRFVAEPIPLETMVEAFAHTANPEATRAFYLEAYAMVRLLQGLWQDKTKSSEQDLVALLTSERATPESLFEEALRERAGTLDRPPLALLETFIENGFR